MFKNVFRFYIPLNMGKKDVKETKMTLFHRVTTKHVQSTFKFSLNVKNFV